MAKVSAIKPKGKKIVGEKVPMKKMNFSKLAGKK